MPIPRIAGRSVVILGLALALAGCGLGPGESSEGTATLTVTRDYGSQSLADATVTDPSGSETVLRFLDREAEITTRYGGGFVQSIEGISGGVEDGRREDWFFYVNGIESSQGSADRPVEGGDRVWWDHHDWTDVMRVPAVVGSWPEPFLQASADDPEPAAVECSQATEACELVGEQLDAAGVAVSEDGALDGPRVLVGAWEAIRDDPAASLLGDGPRSSGVFARFEQRGAGMELVGLGEDGSEQARLGAGAGLVAAVRVGEDQPTWLVTGTDGLGVETAAGALTAEALADNFAVVVGAGSEATLPLPVAPEGE